MHKFPLVSTFHSEYLTLIPILRLSSPKFACLMSCVPWSQFLVHDTRVSKTQLILVRCIWDPALKSKVSLISSTKIKLHPYHIHQSKTSSHPDSCQCVLFACLRPILRSLKHNHCAQLSFKSSIIIWSSVYELLSYSLDYLRLHLGMMQSVGTGLAVSSCQPIIKHIPSFNSFQSWDLSHSWSQSQVLDSNV